MLNRLLEQVNRKRAERRRQIASLLCLSLLVSLAVGISVRRTGIALSGLKMTLVCPYCGDGAEPVAHVHNASCLDGAGNLVCPLPERQPHLHTEACYREEREQICGLEENPGHVHEDACYTEETLQICGLEVNPGHRHTEDCFQEGSEEPACGLEEGEGAHEHTEECFRTEKKLICGKETGEGAHVHSDSCYQNRRVLSCELEELPVHVHDDSCFRITEIPEEQAEEPSEEIIEEPEDKKEETGEKEAPAEKKESSAEEKEEPEEKKDLAEGKEAPEEKKEASAEKKEEPAESKDLKTAEEKSTPEPEAAPKEEKEAAPEREEEEEERELPEKPASDFSADLETAEVWEKAFEDLKLTGVWAEDVIAVAETQFGYSESERNFDAVLNDDRDAYILKGWTRYGAWYGIPYGDWCAMFVSFCLHYAGITDKEYPYDCATTTWVRSLEEKELFSPASEYSPMPGDLVFFDWEQDGLTDHVGLVYGVDEKDNYLLTIEGNHSRTVGTFEYLLNDPRIMGYGILKYVEEPENEETEEAEETEGAKEPEEAEKSETVEEPEKVKEPKKEVEPENTENAGEENLTEGSNPAPVQNDTEAQAAGQSGDQDTETRREPDEPLPPTGSELPKRVQRFDKSVAGIRVQVEADEGAFPENTYMSLAPIDGNFLKDALSDEVDGEILEIQAVDIVFVNEFGEELEPAIPIRVSITVQETQYSDRATDVIHIDDNGTPSVVPQLADEGTESNCEILFDASSFTPYAVVRRTGEPVTPAPAADRPMAEQTISEQAVTETETTEPETLGQETTEQEITEPETAEPGIGPIAPIAETKSGNSSPDAERPRSEDSAELVPESGEEQSREAEKNARAELPEPEQLRKPANPVDSGQTADRRLPESALPVGGRSSETEYWIFLGIFSALAMGGSLWLLEKSCRRTL